MGLVATLTLRKKKEISLMLKLENIENYVEFYRPGLIKTKAF